MRKTATQPRITTEFELDHFEALKALSGIQKVSIPEYIRRLVIKHLASIETQQPELIEKPNNNNEIVEALKNINERINTLNASNSKEEKARINAIEEKLLKIENANSKNFKTVIESIDMLKVVYDTKNLDDLSNNFFNSKEVEEDDDYLNQLKENNIPYEVTEQKKETIQQKKEKIQQHNYSDEEINKYEVAASLWYERYHVAYKNKNQVELRQIERDFKITIGDAVEVSKYILWKGGKN